MEEEKAYPAPSGGSKRRRAYTRGRRSRFKSDSTNLRWTKGQQKWFAKNYLGIPRDDIRRRAFRTFIGNTYRDANPDQKIVRRALGYYGEGDYKQWLRKYIPKGSFSYLGRKLGGMSGIPGLDAAGSWAGNKLANYVGFGDYTSNQIAGGSPSEISVNQSDMTGDIYVTRKEFVRNITVSGTAGQPTAFSVQRFELNPGIANTFPWLSQIAQNFTLYDFEGLMFQYKPLFSEDAGTSSNLGKVIMATNYDPDQGNFRSSVEMANYDYANSCKPSAGLVHGVETAQHQQSVNMMYVRTGVSDKDKVFTDVGSFQVATEGIPLAAGATTAIIGELWVAYRVKLSRAELYNSLLGYSIATDYIQGTTSAAALTTGTTTTLPTNSIGVTIFPVSATGFLVQFPARINLGYYQVVVWFESGGTVFTTQAQGVPSNYTNCQYYTPGRSGPGPVSGEVGAPRNVVGATSNQTILMMSYVKIDSPGLAQASFQVNVSAALTNTTVWRVWVTQANGQVAEQ